MRRYAAFLVVIVAIGSMAAKPADLCERKPTHPKCQPVSEWTLVFSDDFGAPSEAWSAYPCCWRDTSGNGMHHPAKVISVHDGYLDLWLHLEDGQPLVAAPRLVPPLDRQLYGRYEVRFRADPVPGWKTAWLLWPTSETWPRDGEIDFPEGNLNGTIWGFVHHQGATSGSDQDAYPTGVSYVDWHTAVIEWTPGSVKFYLDGRLIGHSTDRVPNTEMRWVLQTETAMNGDVPTQPAHVLIDHVRIWSYR